MSAPQPPERLTGKTVAVVGSGPAGLAVAQQLTRAGHTVAVYERADKPGGLLRYGIPEFKMEKAVLDRRIGQMEAEGTRFRCGVDVGGSVTGSSCATATTRWSWPSGPRLPRDLPVPGRDVRRRPAGDGLPAAGQPGRPRRDGQDQVTATGKDVIVIGGGDTGADCIGTSHRQGRRSVTSLEIMPQPGADRPGSQPWPTYPMIFRVASAHEEGGERLYAVSTRRSSRTTTARSAACGSVMCGWGRRGSNPSRAPSASARAVGLARHGLPRAAAGRPGRAARRRRWMPGATSCGTRAS
jgi:glutamate synthase (NADPH/NADH) small chain